MTQETMQRDFTVDTPAQLFLSNIRGSVDVQAGEAGVISIQAVKHTDTGDAERTEIVMEQNGSGEVRVETKYGNGVWDLIGRREPCKVNYTVHLPRTCVLRVNCVSSAISAQDLKGAFELKTVSGSLTLKGLSGRLRVSTVSGDLRGEQVSGSADVGTVSSAMQLDQSELEAIEATSVSGDIALQVALGEGPHRIKTVSGDVRLMLPGGAGCTVEMSSLSGRLKVPGQTTGRQKNRQGQFEVNGGGPRVRFSSVSGDLTVGVAGSVPGAEKAHVAEEPSAGEMTGTPEVAPLPEAPAVPPAPPTLSERPAPKTRLEVLDLISRGVLSAEDGLVAIKSLKRR